MAHALIFGASGISGWAVAKQCLEDPAFVRITALTNRQYSVEDLLLPAEPRLQIIGGIDLTKPSTEVTTTLKNHVPGIESVTHVFYSAYIDLPDHFARKELNTTMLHTAISAVLNLAGKNLQVAVLQTGAKHYGVDKFDIPLSLPLMENAPRILPPYSDTNFYYSQSDVLAFLSHTGKLFKFYEIRPDVIVGFTPSNNVFNIAQGLAFFFVLFREIYGEGAEVPFVGSREAWTNTHLDSSQDIIAKLSVHVALNSNDIPSGTALNAADSPIPMTWRQKWPLLAAYFGLKGVPPGPLPADVGSWALMNLEKWKGIEERHGLKKGLFEKYNWKFIEGVCTWYCRDREMDLSNSRKFGFEERIEGVEGWERGWERMRRVGIIP